MRRRIQKHIDEIFKDFLQEIEESFQIEIEDSEPVFPIEVVCKMAHLPYWTLRSIIKEGIVKPKKVGKKKVLFSKEDIKKVECIKYLMEKKGVNIKGIKMFFEISGQL